MKRRFLLATAILLPLGAIAIAQNPGTLPGVNSNLNAVFNIPLDGTKHSYGAASVLTTQPASQTDAFVICGSATKLVRVNRIRISGRATAVQGFDFVILKRSAVNAGGTTVTITPVALDSTSPTATATSVTYTGVATTLGTLVGPLVQEQLVLGNLTTGVGGPPLVASFSGDRSTSAPLALRGVAQCVAVNLGTTTITGGVLDFSASWTEE